MLACRSLRGQELQVALESIGSYWQSMPKPDSVLSLVSFDAAPTIPEYLRIFHGPVDVDLESDRVWPMPQMQEMA